MAGDRDGKDTSKGRMQGQSSGGGGQDRNAPRRRSYSAPAAELHPPGMGKRPQVQGYAMEPKKETERRVLKEELKPRVRGEIAGPGSLLDNDWGVMKAADVRAFDKAQERRKRGQVNVVKQQPKSVEQKRAAGEREVHQRQSAGVDRSSGGQQVQKVQSRSGEAPSRTTANRENVAEPQRAAAREQATRGSGQQQQSGPSRSSGAGVAGAEPQRAAGSQARSIQQQQVSDQAYLNMLEERGRKLRERSEGRTREPGRDRD